MKMKDVCIKTGLTERTIRFYTEKGLVSPLSREMNGRVYYEYGEEDISRLARIAALRKAGFAIESILEMINSPDKIDIILNTHYHLIKQESEDALQLAIILEAVRKQHFSSMETLADSLLDPTSNVDLPQTDISPNFAKFDTATKEEKEEAYFEFKVNQRIREKREMALRLVIRALGILLGMAALLLILVGISGIPASINKEYTACQFQISNAGILEQTSVKIKGKLYRRWFSDPMFKGEINIGNIGYTNNSSPVEVVFYDTFGGRGWLVYHSIKRAGEDVIPDIKSAAMVWIDKKFDKVVFQLEIPAGEGSGYYSDLLLCAPADLMEDGIRILEEMNLLEEFKKYEVSN